MAATFSRPGKRAWRDAGMSCAADCGMRWHGGGHVPVLAAVGRGRHLGSPT